MALSPALRKSVSEAKNKYGRSDGKRIKPAEGRNVFRIIAPTFEQAPWVGESGKFWADLGVHWIKAEKNGKPIAVVGSRDVCYQEPCAVGTAVDLALSSYAHDEQTKEIFKEWTASKTVLFNAINRTTNPDAMEVEILEIRPTVAQQIFDLMEQYDDAGQDITDFNSGVDIVITRSGKGLNTEYTVNAKPGVSKPVVKDAITKTHDLHEHIAKEFFRGEDTKALNAIGSIAGIPATKLQAIAGGAAAGALQIDSSAVRTATSALTSSAVAVDDATTTVEATATVTDAELEAAVAGLEKTETPVVEATATPVAETPAAATATPTATPAVAEAAVLSDQGVDDVLSELDNLVL